MNEFKKAIAQMQTAATLSLAVYSSNGEPIGGDPFAAVFPHGGMALNFDALGIALLTAEDLTCFLLRKNHSTFLGVLKGSNESSRKLAALVKIGLENALFSETPLTKAEKFRRMLKSELSTTQLDALRADYADGICHYYVLSVATDNAHKLHELKAFLETIAERDDIVVPCEDRVVAYFKKCGGADEYQSANDFAHTLYDNIKEELRINIVINVGGTAHSFDELPVFFRQCEFAYNFGRLLAPDEKIYSYKEYIMIKMLSDIPKSTLTQYLGTLLDRDSLTIVDDEELMSTAEAFLKNSLNIAETSRNMYIHRNTLIYRLDKIEQATGLNIRHFNDAVVFKLITVLNKLTTR